MTERQLGVQQGIGLSVAEVRACAANYRKWREAGVDDNGVPWTAAELLEHDTCAEECDCLADDLDLIGRREAARG